MFYLSLLFYYTCLIYDVIYYENLLVSQCFICFFLLYFIYFSFNKRYLLLKTNVPVFTFSTLYKAQKLLSVNLDAPFPFRPGPETQMSKLPWDSPQTVSNPNTDFQWRSLHIFIVIATVAVVLSLFYNWLRLRGRHRRRKIRPRRTVRTPQASPGRIPAVWVGCSFPYKKQNVIFVHSCTILRTYKKKLVCYFLLLFQIYVDSF